MTILEGLQADVLCIVTSIIRNGWERLKVSCLFCGRAVRFREARAEPAELGWSKFDFLHNAVC